MILFVFSIRDRAVDAFDRPLFTVSKGQMMRSFQDEANRDAKDNQIFQHPEDFELWELGTFETSDGSFVCHRPEMVAVAKDLLIRGS